MNLGCVKYSIREMTKFNVSRSCLRKSLVAVVKLYQFNTAE